MNQSSTAPLVPIAAGLTKDVRRVERSHCVTHVVETLDCGFDSFKFKFEMMLGRFDRQDVALAATDVDRAIERLKGSQGEQGLMIFDSNEHGALFPLAGLPARKAIRYYLGNPLIALKMTQRAIGAALYAPLSLLVHTDEKGWLNIEYDLPSTVFAQFSDAEIDKVAASLDAKLQAVLAKAAAG